MQPDSLASLIPTLTAAVPMLVAGAGFEFDDRGQHELKGIDDTWQLLALKG